jgi:cytochrome c oxidase subunit II
MTNTAWVIAIAYTAATLVGVAVVLFIFRSTRVGFHVRTASRETLARREGMWGIVVIVFLVALLGATVFSVPYFGNAKQGTGQSIHITGRQFAWTVDPPRVRAGVSTFVEADSTDVSHAIGLYDPSDTLVKKVNVLPGVTQDFTITLDEPGTYTIRCLEFCGVDHHLMENELEVTP